MYTVQPTAALLRASSDRALLKHLATSASLRHQKSTCTRGRTPRTHTSSADPSRIGTKYSLQRRMHQNETDSYAKHTNTVPLTARTQNPSRFPQRSTSALFFVFYTCPENSRTIFSKTKCERPLITNSQRLYHK